MKKAAAYARVSGQKQSVNGNSIPVLLARKKPRGEKTTGTKPRGQPLWKMHFFWKIAVILVSQVFDRSKPGDLERVGGGCYCLRISTLSLYPRMMYLKRVVP